MKRDKLLIIIGGIFLVVGVVLFSLKKEKNVTYVYEETKMNKEDAISLIIEKVSSVIDLYEKKESVFNTVDESEENKYLLVNNYEDVIKNVYTEKGINEFESIKFGNDLFVKKEEDKIYLLKKIPESNSFLNSTISVEIKSIALKSIDAVVSLSSNSLDDTGTLTYYVYEKNIKLIKLGDKWLINTFIYNN